VAGINFAVYFTRADGKQDPETPLTELVRHFSYVADRVGVDHLAFGSDFDGAIIPSELGAASGLPKLVKALRAGGFSLSDLRKIAHEDWIRVLDMTWGTRIGC
jgi:membrane dipeptidase